MQSSETSAITRAEEGSGSSLAAGLDGKSCVLPSASPVFISSRYEEVPLCCATGKIVVLVVIQANFWPGMRRKENQASDILRCLR